MLHKISLRISGRLSLCVLWFSKILRHKFDLYILYQKPKSLVVWGRGDLTRLFFSKVVKYIEVRGDFSSNLENNKSFTSRPSGLWN